MDSMGPTELLVKYMYYVCEVEGVSLLDSGHSDIARREAMLSDRDWEQLRAIERVVRATRLGEVAGNA